ncbi:MAG: hypothetical protein U5K75_11995 [Ahrensia sp.]|nr:hypothetical protein [Ahrensia sp.]
MTTRIIRTESEIDGLSRLLKTRKLPVTVSIVAGAARTDAQNRLIQKWNGEIAQQRGDVSFEEVRAENKLRFGVPILRRDDEAFCAAYDATFRHLPYDVKLALFIQLDPAVTRRMTTKQLSEYADTLQRHYLQDGFVLTAPIQQA